MTESTVIDKIWDVLRNVNDPEVPVLNVVDMGVVRSVSQENEKIKVVITPTYSGCPAMDIISMNIRVALSDYDVEIETVLYPPWTTDWLTEDAKSKLKAYGIAPPTGSVDKHSILSGEPRVIACPKCDSQSTTMVSQFGSTACKAHYKCNDCLEPFDYFKCV